MRQAPLEIAPQPGDECCSCCPVLLRGCPWRELLVCGLVIRTLDNLEHNSPAEKRHQAVPCARRYFDPLYRPACRNHHTFYRITRIIEAHDQHAASKSHERL